VLTIPSLADGQDDGVMPELVETLNDLPVDGDAE
jgi:hypothetical protein